MKAADAYDFAWTNARRNPDGSVIESSVVDILADSIDFDADEARRGKAQRILARRKRPGQTAPEGAVVFPDMEHYAYEPRRVLADDKGNVIENADASIRFKTAEARRAQQGAQAASARATREQNEAGWFAEWAAEQLAGGRNPKEVTWDNCLRETGLWKDVDVEVDSSDDDSTEDES